MRWIVAIFVALLAGCSTVPTTQVEATSFFNDSLFMPASAPTESGDIFAMSDEMRTFMNREIGSSMHGVDRRHALFDALYSKQKLKLEYDSTITRNAAQAFADRSGNCLSLVILTAAFAKQMGVPVQYQNVFSNQTISRINDIIYVSGHVNLSLTSEQTGTRLADVNIKPMTIDFLPPKETAGQHVRVIRETTIVAMYLNNRAAETFSEGRIDDAYHWARSAIEQDPTLLAAYNTLAVIYLHHGNLPQAEQVLRYLVKVEPEDPTPITNLVAVLNKLGLTDESRNWQEKLAKIQLFPPFHYFDIGMQAMHDKDYPKAQEMFAKEITRAPYYHEFHAWLAAADYELGDGDGARKELALAIEYSTTPADRDLYTARLAVINSSRGKLMRH
jgi:tetratricopeptide (TPR) repeat protein